MKKFKISPKIEFIGTCPKFILLPKETNGTLGFEVGGP